MKDCLLPLERWFKTQSANREFFPHGNKEYFKRYEGIKDYLTENVYPLIGAATSSGDQGVYTDHGPDHFDAVIRYAGKLLNVPANTDGDGEICISPYEVFVLLVSILLHDAGNIYGREGHEKHPHTIFRDMGSYLCPDVFEAKIITNVATAHGGTVPLHDGSCSKDTISNLLNDEDKYSDIIVRQKFIAALVRFSDEICEDRKRAARFMLNQGILPKCSEVFHAYANGISSVGVDLVSKSINLKIELMRENVTTLYGKGSRDSWKKVYLIEEIFSRLEKMFCEMIYCQRFMSQHIKLDRIRATICIYDTSEEMNILKQKAFELEEKGYPSTKKSLLEDHPEWSGDNLKLEMDSAVDHE